MRILAYGLTMTLTAIGFSGSAQAETKDIVDTAVSAKSFGTLVTAVKAAGLVETLKGDGPFTVFAPTDEAFAKLPKGTVETLLKPENKELLTSILTYHVVAGEVKAADVVKLSGAATVNGQHVDISAANGVMIDGAKVVTTDILCSNGVIRASMLSSCQRINRLLASPRKQACSKHLLQRPLLPGSPECLTKKVRSLYSHRQTKLLPSFL